MRKSLTSPDQELFLVTIRAHTKDKPSENGSRETNELDFKPTFVAGGMRELRARRAQCGWLQIFGWADRRVFPKPELS